MSRHEISIIESKDVVEMPTLHTLTALPNITCPKCRKSGNGMYGKTGDQHAFKFVCFHCDLDVVLVQKEGDNHQGYYFLDRNQFIQDARRKLSETFASKVVVSIEAARTLKRIPRRS